MAEIPARVSIPKQGGSGITLVSWTTLTENDTAQEVITSGTGPIACALQVIGTFGGATAVLQGSNDGVNWVTIPDVNNSSVGLTSAGVAEYSTSVVYLRASASGGTSQDIDVILSLRG